MFGGGAIIALSAGSHPGDFRIQVMLVFLAGAVVVGTLPWNPLSTGSWQRTSPTRLIIAETGLRLELLRGGAVEVGWTSASFRVSLWTWPRPVSGDSRWTMDLGSYSSVPLPVECYESVRAALISRHFIAEERDFRMLFGQGVVRGVTYVPPRSGALTSSGAR
jgi:hypothetical protein